MSRYVAAFSFWLLTAMPIAIVTALAWEVLVLRPEYSVAPVLAIYSWFFIRFIGAPASISKLCLRGSLIAASAYIVLGVYLSSPYTDETTSDDMRNLDIAFGVVWTCLAGGAAYFSYRAIRRIGWTPEVKRYLLAIPFWALAALPMLLLIWIAYNQSEFLPSDPLIAFIVRRMTYALVLILYTWLWIPLTGTATSMLNLSSRGLRMVMATYSAFCIYLLGFYQYSSPSSAELALEAAGIVLLLGFFGIVALGSLVGASICYGFEHRWNKVIRRRLLYLALLLGLLWLVLASLGQGRWP